MAPFANIALDYQNFSFGPVSGRVYSIDHVADSMVVKTIAGTLVSTNPLNIGVPNEILSLEFDGYYFWSLAKLGGDGSLGVVINKWFLNGAILEKQTGIGNEINLINIPTSQYDSEAFCVERYATTLAFPATSGTSSITVASGSIQFLELGMSVYIGPSTIGAGEVLERTVTSISGNVLGLNAPLTVGFATNNQVIYRRNIWLFNNKNLAADNGSLLQINSYDGSLVSNYTSCEWKHVTAATFNNGNISFVRNHQLLRYRPFGTNAGYQSSAILNNIEVDNTTLIKVYDIEIDASNVYKLQKKQHQYDTVSHTFSDVTSTTNDYELDQEIIASKVTSITATRDRSVLFGAAITADYVIQVRDQYNVPILGRSFAITEDDASGLISPGFTSFTTNSNGQGTTRYSTGTTPTFRNPTVFATDVPTQLRLNLLLETLPSGSNFGFVQQDGKISNQSYLEQRTVTGIGMLGQYTLGSFSLLEQAKADPNLMPIEQYVTSGGTLVEQDPLLSQITLLEQQRKLPGTITVIQYDFLIFAIPEPYSIKNPVNTNILVRIIGFGASPLNASTLVFKVNGIDITSQVVITPFGGGLELFYNPSADFPYSSTVLVEISIQDTNLPPRTVTTTYTFDIVPDVKKPMFEQVYPPDHSTGNLPLTEVYAIIKDLESGIDISSIQMFIEGKQLIPFIEDLGSGRVKISYQTLEPYLYEAEISASVFAEDNEGNKFVGAWTFKIRPSSGVLFNDMDPDTCDNLVPIDTDVCIEIFGLEDGLDLDSLTFNVDGKDVTYVLQPKVLRRG